MLQIAAIFSVSSGLGYLLPAIIGLESMGVPSPGETALVAAAVLASQGHLNIWLVIVIGAASAILGDNIGYLLGRKLGREVLVSRGPFHDQRARVIEIGDRYFKRHGAKTVFIGRWIALIRFATAWLAGINHMPLRTFFPGTRSAGSPGRSPTDWSATTAGTRSCTSSRASGSSPPSCSRWRSSARWWSRACASGGRGTVRSIS